MWSSGRVPINFSFRPGQNSTAPLLRALPPSSAVALWFVVFPQDDSIAFGPHWRFHCIRTSSTLLDVKIYFPHEVCPSTVSHEPTMRPTKWTNQRYPQTNVIVNPPQLSPPNADPQKEKYLFLPLRFKRRVSATPRILGINLPIEGRVTWPTSPRWRVHFISPRRKRAATRKQQMNASPGRVPWGWNFSNGHASCLTR